jgi:2-keto-3-deoxy-6-phosphogluconate aldolase
MKCRFLIAAAAMLTLALVQDAAAQGKNYICSPGGVEKCVAACNSRGGQIRKCPTWCSQQRQERCR